MTVHLDWVTSQFHDTATDTHIHIHTHTHVSKHMELWRNGTGFTMACLVMGLGSPHAIYGWARQAGAITGDKPKEG